MKIRTLKELHKAFHEASAADRTTAIANCKEGLEKAAGMEPDHPIHSFLKAEMGRHTAMLEHHVTTVEECEKADTGLDLEKQGDAEFEWLRGLVKSMVIEATGDQLVYPMSKVAPTAQTLVPRPGSPTPAAAAAKVPLEFAKLIAIDEDDQAS